MQAEKSSIRGTSLPEWEGGLKEDQEDGDYRLAEDVEKWQDPKGKRVLVHAWWRRRTEKQWPQQRK